MYTKSIHSRTRLVTVAVAGAATAVATLAVLVGTGVLSGSQPPTSADPRSSLGRTATDFQSANLEEGELCSGQETFKTLKELAATAATPIWMPNTDEASVSTLVASVLCGETPTLRFDSGITVAYEPGWRLENPQKRWNEMAKEWGGKVQAILGQPAYIFDLNGISNDPDVQPVSGATPTSEVLVVLDDTLVRVIGPKIEAKRLIELTESIEPDSPM